MQAAVFLKMKKIILYFLFNPTAAFMTALFLIIAGIISIPKLSFQPAVQNENKEITILARYPGMNAARIEKILVRPIENELADLPGISDIYSVSEDSSAKIFVYFHSRVKLAPAVNEIRSRLDGLSSRFPREAEKPVVLYYNPLAEPFMIISLHQPGFTAGRSREYAEKNLKPRLARIPGIGEIEIAGGLIDEILVSIDPDRLKASGLGLSDIISSLQKNNISLPAGNIKNASMEIPVFFNGRFNSVYDISQTRLGVSGRIKLSDLAEINRNTRTPENHASMNGSEKILLYLYKTSEASLLECAVKIKKEIAGCRDAEIEITHNAADSLTQALNSIITALIFSGISALLVLGLLTGDIRIFPAVLLSLPVSLLPAFIFMSVKGSLSIMHLSGLALACGLVLDSSIIICEVLKPQESIRASTLRVYGILKPLAAGIFTTLIVFLPVLFFKNDLSAVFRDLSAGVSVCLLISLAASLFITPSCYLFLKKKLPSGSGFFLKLSDLIFMRIDAVYMYTLEYCRKNPLPLFAGSFLLLFFSIVFMQIIRQEHFELAPSEYLRCQLELPSGTSLKRTVMLSEKLGINLTNLIPQIYSVQLKAEPGHAVFLLKSSVPDKTLSVLKKTFPSWYEGSLFFSSRSGMENDREIEIELLGANRETLPDLALRAGKKLQSLSIAEEVIYRFKEKRPGYSWVPKNHEWHDISAALAADTLRNSLYGAVAEKYLENNSETDIRIRLASGYDGSRIFLKTSNQAAVNLENVFKQTSVSEDMKIFRKNRKYLLQISLIRSKRTGFYNAVNAVNQALADLPRNTDENFEIGGNFREKSRSNFTASISVLLSFLLIYFLLASVYKNTIMPLLVLIPLPFSAAGAVIFMLIAGIPFSLPAYLGFMLLFGIAVNNSILLGDAILDSGAAGKNKSDFYKIVSACRKRLKPAMITALTTIASSLAALLPAQGGSLFRPVFLIAAAGMFFSLFFVMLLVPLTSFYISRQNFTRLERVSLLQDSMVHEG
ncbi:MAG: hypothetical protein A2096_11335 [Spirochaetes bacterium GWF1_41_5]|nr:MAG: hypothetical protein A2096_11335 [Spirochaetes bacterium GWF1_41_5]